MKKAVGCRWWWHAVLARAKCIQHCVCPLRWAERQMEEISTGEQKLFGRNPPAVLSSRVQTATNFADWIANYAASMHPDTHFQRVTGATLGNMLSVCQARQAWSTGLAQVQTHILPYSFVGRDGSWLSSSWHVHMP